jgi:predicted Zn-dependent protease
LADRVLGLSQAEGCQVNIGFGASGNTRYAAQGISTAGDTTNATATVSSRFGKRTASVTTNVFDDQGLMRAVRTSEQLARIAPENPEVMPLLSPQEYAQVPAFAQTTAGLDAAGRAASVRAALAAVGRQPGLVAAGFLERTAGADAVANSAGLFAYHASTAAAHTITVRTADGTGSGWAGTAHNDSTLMTSPEALAVRASTKARDSREPVTLEPGKYTVVLEPMAAGNLLRLLGFALNARTADEGRSFFSKRGGGNKIGEKVVDARVTIVSDPADPDLLLTPYTPEGYPAERTVWIENGVVKNLAYDRFWADKQGKKPVPFPTGFKMQGGTASHEELIAQVERGVLVTRFWYIRSVDPRTVLYTGLTRDGVFLIEHGKVSRAVRNFRFNESPVAMLNNLVALGHSERISPSESGSAEGGAAVVPAMVCREFTFSSISEAV